MPPGMQQAVADAQTEPRSFVLPHPPLPPVPLDGPRFKRRMLWDNDPSIPVLSPAALSTLYAPPLPTPPPSLLSDPSIISSLQSLSPYIKVETPFAIDRLEFLLSSHPNRPFVDSVIRGLREGFWPFDAGEWDLELKDPPANFASSDEDLLSIRAFRDKEVNLERWSGILPFNTLLPGMASSPLFVVWQKEKARVITDHSASGLNDGIPRSEAKVKYDDMLPFGQTIHSYRSTHPPSNLVLFKSDVASAFLNLPAHPLWQMRQIVSIDGSLHIVRRLVFGNRASPRIWCSVSALLCWIAIVKYDVKTLHVYMDDFFGLDHADNLVDANGRLLPRRQAQLLRFWTFIKCPYEDKKQEWGHQLKIIGFWVDAPSGSISLSPEAVTQLVDKIHSFLAFPGRKPPLREWQRLAGYINWAFNVFPWGRPALSSFYRKISAKSHIHSAVPINASVKHDLTWLMDTLPGAIGIRFVDSMRWLDDDADLVAWTDANLRDGLAFCFHRSAFIYSINTPLNDAHRVDIFFLELMAIVSLVAHVAAFQPPPRRLLVYSDSLDSVASLNSLSTSTEMHTAPLLALAKVILHSGIDLRVRHIDGVSNVRADLLSRMLLVDYRRAYPDDTIAVFEPPRLLLPERWRVSF